MQDKDTPCSSANSASGFRRFNDRDFDRDERRRNIPTLSDVL